MKNNDIQSVNITVLGKGMVGKSSLIYKFINNEVSLDHEPTIEDKISIVKSINGKNIQFNILDTAGQTDYQTSSLDSWIEFGDGFILIFGVDDMNSFKELNGIKERIDKLKRKSKPALMLIGNKCDLVNERQVLRKEGVDKANKWEGCYIETSVMKNVNCSKPFYDCYKEILHLRKENEKERKNSKVCIIF